MTQMNRRDALRLGALTAGTFALGVQTAHADADEADYVVIGSGPGGSPLAARLAEAGYSVIVLEAGPPEGKQSWYNTPVLHNKASGSDERIRWDYFVQHYSDAAMNRSGSQWVAGRGVLYPRASTLGGCSAHNALITMYPDPSDWAYIQRLTGDNSWSPEAMWGHWESVRGWQPMEIPKLIEAVAIDPQLGGLIKAAKEEALRLPGGDLIADPHAVNAPSNVSGKQGFVLTPQMSRNGKRYGPRERLLSASNRNAARLTILTDILAQRILLESGPDGRQRAVGVECQVGRHLYGASPYAEAGAKGSRRTIRARKEVILAAGAFNSPQLLMLSGIGPAAHLAKHGIPTIIDLPGVGGNLQDRYEVAVVTRHRPFDLIKLCTFDVGVDPCMALNTGVDTFGFGGFSPYSFNGVVGGIKRRFGSDPRAQLFVFGAPADFRGYVPGYGDAGYVHDAFTWLVLKGYAGATGGTVRLRSPDPTHPPFINFRKFDDGRGGADDCGAMVDSVEMIRRINGAAGSGTEIWPGPGVTGRDQLGQWVRKESWGHHASCSNPIGAVLDSKFVVRGTSNLRVVDASAFPRIPGLFIWAPTAIISEKAASDILNAT